MMKMLENFGENRVSFVEKCKHIKSSGMGSIGQVKQNYPRANSCAFGPKTKRALKSFKKTLRFLDQNLNGKFTFFHIFY